MDQAGDVQQRVGYAVKRVQAALNVAMDRRLRGLGLGVSQYACLAQLDRSPGLTNADLARAVFVSRQATHQLLAGLVGAGFVTVSGSGRQQRLTLSPSGAEVLARASAVVGEVEEQMLAGLPPDGRATLAETLLRCADALEVSGHAPGI